MALSLAEERRVLPWERRGVQGMGGRASPLLEHHGLGRTTTTMICERKKEKKGGLNRRLLWVSSIFFGHQWDEKVGRGYVTCAICSPERYYC